MKLNKSLKDEVVSDSKALWRSKAQMKKMREELQISVIFLKSYPTPNSME